MNAFRSAGWGLSTRVAVCSALLLVVLLAIIVYAQRQAIEERRAAELANAADFGESIAGLVDGYAASLEVSTSLVASRLASLDASNQETAGPLLKLLKEQYSYLRAVFVTDLTGRVVASDSGVGNGTNLADRTYVRALQGGALQVWSPAVIGVESGQVVATFSRQIRDPNNPAQGYLIVAFYPPNLAEVLPASLAPDADVSVFDSTGLLLYSSRRSSLTPAERNQAAAPELRQAQNGSVEVDGTASFFPDQRRFGVVAPVPRTGWTVAYTRPSAALDGLLRDRILRQAGLVTAAVLLTGALLTAYTRLATRPLRALARSAGAIARGERPAEAHVTSSISEVRELATAMQVMNAAVSQRERALEQARAAAEADAAMLATMNEIARIVSAQLELDAAVQSVTEAATEAVHAQFGAFFYNRTDASGDSYMLYALSGVDRAAFEGYPMPRATAIFGPTFRGEGTVRIDDVTTDPRYGMNTPYSGMPEGHLSVRSYLAASVVGGDGEVIGGLIFGHPEPGRFTAREDRLAEGVASQAAIAIQNSRLYSEAQRALAAREEFLGIASHELRTPLTTLRGYAQLLDRRTRAAGGDQFGAGEAAREILNATTRLEDLVTDLLDTSRIQSGRLELNLSPTDLAEVARTVVQRFEHDPLLTDRHSLILDAPRPLTGIWDAGRLDQVLTNLVSNALKFSPDGGEVRLALSEDSGFATVRVEDHGIGIPFEQQQGLFQPFVRGHASRAAIPGTGLGLYITEQIVARHSGRVFIESRPGVGTTVTVQLPVTEVAQAPPVPAVPQER